MMVQFKIRYYKGYRTGKRDSEILPAASKYVLKVIELTRVQ